MTKTFVLNLFLFFQFFLVACSSNAPIDNSKTSTEELTVGVLQVQPVIMRISAETVAQTEGAKEIDIRPRVGGIVLKRYYHEGMAVKAGQPLYLIDPEPFQKTLAEVRAAFLEQSIRVMQANTEKARQEKLVAENFVSKRSYDNAVADLRITEAALHALKARVEHAELDVSYTTVKAPIDGITGRSQISEGVLVAANTSVLTTMMQVSPIWVRFSFSDNELVRFNGRLNEDNVEEVILIFPDGSEYPLSGKINFAASEIDPLIGTQQLRATFENPDHRLLPGQFVRVRVVAGETDQVFLLPQVAVMTSDLGRYVYVVDEKNIVTKRRITVGEWVGKDWIILDGLQSGDKVVINNLIRLSPDMSVNPELMDASEVLSLRS
ncbi:membrane fusion protein, multidrug efflux system [Nitrosomonas aestuarii]|uniref:Membrane fusion protein, multidrug efflux system n=1 Tax=Nitrosomonas aestuarii TaxID=52441 RepID=A0A1I3XXN3_9PROT|nr:efflux RND transporter periplasmic adaptor subunit [Nitrosomonas aestuarii]SFK24029.1 membrane fusion protein, multidrug efflux system [Nitrosomonas aestuarii]